VRGGQIRTAKLEKLDLRILIKSTQRKGRL